jgi:atypical dual specificity phosphatase
LHTVTPAHTTLEVPPYFTNRLGPPDCSVVVPELVVGAYLEPHDLPWLAGEREVRAVLNLQDDFDLAAKRLSLPALRSACDDAGVAFDRVPVADGDHETLARRLPDIVRRLDELVRRHGRVYLHCNAGMNRAPTVAIAYLHVHHDLGLQAAVALMKSKRSCLPYVTALKAAYPRRPSLRVPKA